MFETTLISYLIVGFLGAILGSFLMHEYDNYGKAKKRLKIGCQLNFDVVIIINKILKILKYII